MARQIRIMGRTNPGKVPDLAALEEIVSPRILEAMRTASAQLKQSGIRHALAGGLAVGAYGFARATKDVDFLVGDEAFRRHAGGIVTIAPGVPIQVQGVAIDPLSIAPDERHLDQALDAAILSGGIPVLPLEALVYLKLGSPRRKDGVDVIELLKAGGGAGPIREYLERHAPALLPKFDDLARAAATEPE